MALKTQQSNEKVRKKRLIGRTSEWSPVGRAKTEGGEQEVQTIGHKISFKDILYNPGMIAVFIATAINAVSY